MKWKLECPVGVAYLPVPTLWKQFSIESELGQKKMLICSLVVSLIYSNTDNTVSIDMDPVLNGPE